MNDEEGAFGYTELDVYMLNRMVQALLSCLPDEYREIVEVESQPVALMPHVSSVLATDNKVAGVVPIAVAVNSPNGDYGQVRFAFGVEMGMNGIFYDNIINVFMTGDNGERDSVSFKTNDLKNDMYERAKAPSVFAGKALGFMERCFANISDIVSVYPSFIEAAGVADDAFMTNFMDLLPDGWDVVFHQSILDDFGIPFVDSFIATHGDDFVSCPVHVSRIGNEVLQVRFPDDGGMLFMNLVDEPDLMRSQMRKDMEPIVFHLLDGVDAEQDNREG